MATFYHFFSLKPQGEQQLHRLHGRHGLLRPPAAEIVAALQDAYGIEAGHTTPDGKFSFNTARCPGSCGLAPV